MILFWKYLADIISKACLNLFWGHITGKLFAVWLQRPAERRSWIHTYECITPPNLLEQKENMHAILIAKVIHFFKDSEKWPVSQC